MSEAFSFADEDVTKPVRALLVGGPITGKSHNTIVGCANAGFNVFVLDFDGQSAAVKPHIKPEFRKNVHAIHISDTEESFKGTDTSKFALQRARRQLIDWKENGKSYGGINNWGPNTVLIVDTLSFAGEAAVILTKRLHKLDLNVPLPYKEYRDAQNYMGTFLRDLCGDNIKCHVVCNAHITEHEDEEKTMQYMPVSGVGKGMDTKLGKYFPIVIRVVSKRVGMKTVYNFKLRGSNFRIEGSDLPDVYDADMGKLILALRPDALKEVKAA